MISLWTETPLRKNIQQFKDLKLFSLKLTGRIII